MAVFVSPITVMIAAQRNRKIEKKAVFEAASDPKSPTPQATSASESFNSSEEVLDRVIESAVIRSVFNGNDLERRQFLHMVGGGTLAATLGSIFPLDAAKAAIKDSLGKPEKTKLNVGFVPITCATPIIMAHPMGFYSKHGLDVDVIKTTGWAVAQDKSLAKEYDASQMLTPMPLAMTLGAG